MKLPFEPNLRTQEEIATRLNEESEMFGFDHEVIIPYASEEIVRAKAKKNGKPFADDEKIEFLMELNVDNILEEMREYAAYGWEKVEDHRGLSASRTLVKMNAWMWLLGDDEGVAAVDDYPYPQYGAPALSFICERYGFPVPHDEPAQNMIAGRPCFPDCDSGCGR